MSNTKYTPGRWAHSPFPLIETPCGAKSAAGQHGSIYMAHEMAHIHNALLRSLNAIYNQASEVKTPKDITDLLLLTKFWHFEMEDHHSVEEKILFPQLEELTGQKGIMDGNIKEHHAFIPGLEALEKYANETTPETYNAEKLRSIISSFAMILQQHLHAEIETLLSLKNYDSDRLISCWHAVHEHVLKNCDKVSFSAIQIVHLNTQPNFLIEHTTTTVHAFHRSQL